ncbi:MAG: GNAT family N-acetyltransferase [Bacteroidia bacterium]|jgi:ribosomal protein S18 acetylase RimI-like enzyme
MTIRPFEVADKDALLAVFKMNVPDFFAPHEADEFEEYLKLYGSTYFTLKKENRIVGGVGYTIKGHEGSITWIFLDPSCSRSGMGKHAVEHCLSVLSSNKQVTAFVVRTSQLAYAFFEKFGYRVIYTEKDYWGKGLDLYQMEMSNKH